MAGKQVNELCSSSTNGAKSFGASHNGRREEKSRPTRMSPQVQPKNKDKFVRHCQSPRRFAHTKVSEVVFLVPLWFENVKTATCGTFEVSFMAGFCKEDARASKKEKGHKTGLDPTTDRPRALNCQATSTPRLYHPFVVFLPEASSLASICPALHRSPVGIAIYPTSIRCSYCRQFCVKVFHRGAKLIWVSNRSHASSKSCTNLCNFWGWGGGVDGGQIQEAFNKHNKICRRRYIDEKTPSVLRKAGQQKFILGSYTIDFAVVLLWLMAGDQTLIHIKAHDRFSVISSLFMESEHGDKGLLRVLRACWHPELVKQ